MEDLSPIASEEDESMISSSSDNEATDGDVVANGVVYKRSKRPGGRWSSDEHRRFIEALRIYGKDWQQIEDAVKTRSSAQIWSHA